MSLLSVKNLNVELQGRGVLETANITIEQGELVGLIGPNGAGKSTLLRAILGLIPTNGAIYISSQLFNKIPRQKLVHHVAYVPQEREVAWPVDVETVVMLGRAQLRSRFMGETAEDHRAVAWAMRIMDVEHLRDRCIRELSCGEQSRVLIARALAQEAPLLLADEPTAGLDPAYQIGLMRTFKALTAKGHGILVCLHDLWLAARWCSRIIVLDKGRIVADGAPEAVLTYERLATVYGIEAYVNKAQDGFMVMPVDLFDTDAGQ